MYIGEDKTVFIAIKDENGDPLDLTGATMEWWLAKTSHSEKTLQKKLGSGLTVVAGTGVNVSLASADTYDLKPEIWYHELKVTLASKLSVTTVGNVHLRPALDMRDPPPTLTDDRSVRGFPAMPQGVDPYPGPT